MTLLYIIVTGWFVAVMIHSNELSTASSEVVIRLTTIQRFLSRESESESESERDWFYSFVPLLIIRFFRQVATSIDDYLWLRLSLISVSSASSDATSSSSESLTLRQIQIQLTEEYGESHFHADEQPLRYAQVLLLTGQYEAAAAFLSRAAGGQLRPHAVHFALAVHALGLLALPSDPIQAPLLSAEVGDAVPMKRLNLARLLTLYTKKFEATDPKEAVQYFYFMKDMNTVQGNSCRERFERKGKKEKKKMNKKKIIKKTKMEKMKKKKGGGGKNH